jgi:hypothetical protein
MQDRSAAMHAMAYLASHLPIFAPLIPTESLPDLHHTEETSFGHKPEEISEDEAGAGLGGRNGASLRMRLCHYHKKVPKLTLLAVNGKS